VIEREARRLERLVGDLLDLARLRRRSFSVAAEHLDLGELAEAAGERHEPAARSLGLHLGVIAEPEALAVADPDRVLQALSNLVENALRSTPSGGSVQIHAGPGRLEVVDDGPGIAEADLPHAFERFYLYDRSSDGPRVGTGLGLAIVRELVETMGGRVDVRSEVGVGSTFSIALPVPEPRAAGADALLGLGLELVADAVARLDERVARGAPIDLLAQLANEHVDGSVAMRRPAAPDALEELVAREHATGLAREGVDEAELGRRELGTLPVDIRLDVVGIEAQLLDLDLVSTTRLRFAHASARCCANTRGELLHRERLDEVVVGADLERVHAVVLRASGGHDDDRCTDPFVSSLLDHAPAVDAGEHEVEDADVGPLVTQPGEPGLSVRHADGVESGRLEVARHPAGDDVVVFDDQDFRHSATP
jgi:hypothetical protein